MAGPKPLKVAPTEHHPRICLDDNARSKFMHSVLKLKDTLIGTRRRRRVTILILVILLPLALLNPIGTVRGLVVNIGRSANGGFTMDAGRIAFVDSTTFRIVVYNLASRSAINLPLLPVGSPGGTPSIQGNKLVIPSTTGLLMPETIYYCVLTTSSCGPWIVIAAGAPSLFFFSQHGFPLVSGDIVVWPVAGGFNYYRFSSAGTAFVATPTQAFTPSTDGETIALAAKPTPASPSMTLMYYETSPPAASAVDTALPTIPVISIAQDIMAFNDNSTVPTCVVGTGGTSCDYRIRYYDFLRSLPSPAGAGPVGTLGAAQSVWADRIVFAIRVVAKL